MTAQSFIKESLEEFENVYWESRSMKGLQEWLSSKLLSAFKTMEEEVRLPYHASFTIKELLDAPETKLQVVKNDAWNSAIDEQAKKIADFLGV